MDQSTVAANELLDQHPSEAAYNRSLTEIDAVEDAEDYRINIDITRAVTTVLGALPKIYSMRHEIEAEFKNFDFESFDKMGQYTLALHHTHTRCRAASKPKQDLSVLGGKLENLRDRLLTDGRSLEGHGLIDGSRLEECGAPGYRAMASDVLVVVNLLKDNWASVQGRTPLTIEGLNAAATQALELLSEVGLREQAPIVMEEVALRRRKAFILFRRTYEAARNAIVYLLGEEAAEEIAPSLWAGRGKRGTSNAVDESGETPVTTDQTAASGAAPRAAASGAAREDFVVDNASGLPITHPLKK